MAGDHIEIKDGGVYVNGVLLDEPYTAKDGSTEPLTERSTWDVPADSLFVLGDHRTASQDSRSPQVGFVKVEPGRRTRVAPLLAARHAGHPPDTDVPGRAASAVTAVPR